MNKEATPILKLENISKTYAKNGAKVEALASTTLALHGGDFAAVRGPSGCGKTTLLLAAGGLLAPDSGKVIIGGQPLYELSPEARARFRADHIGFVFQQFHLIPYLSVLENVMAPGMAVGAREGKARARELLIRFGLEARVNHLPGELSAGEQQRTALARALLLKPKLLLADEPTGNLDRENAARVLDAFEDFADGGGAVLWVTHDDSLIERAGQVIRFSK